MTQLEKYIQADIVKLLETVGAAVYKIGTKRKKEDHQGTMQTPGIPDLVAFVPVPLSLHVAPRPDRVSLVQLWIEVKRPAHAMTSRMSQEQTMFRLRSLEAGCEHVVGGVPEVVDWLMARGVVKG